MTRRLSSPRGLLILGLPAALLVIVPIVAVAWRTPWSNAWSAATTESSRDALVLSLRTSLITTGLALLFGTPLAWMLANSRRRGRSLVRSLLVLPMVLPPVVGGVALLYAFGRKGIVGGILDDWFGIRLAFTETAAIMAQFFVAAPFFIVVMEAAFEQVDQRIIGAARTFGAGPWRTFLTVTLPLVGPSMVAGLVLTWARALGEFGATITFAGNTAGRTQTVPLAVYGALESGSDAALALSMLMVIVSVAVLVSLRGRWIGALQRSGA